ncbi:cytochrome b-c1 complex subunit 10 [Aquila chrysaetos chrysaetos]|uniref:Ubiquinol-cytochrome c reductase, complex III subunit XI n=2 Tax=Neoaves TaxID=3078114 RepID=A0A663EXJ8_AQUCH|nr:cytochrome b-c1 complex subunit 10 [Aquila chrysaetos chrysaetos]
MRGGGDFEGGEGGGMLSKLVGPRYVQLLQNWTPTLVTWGGVAGTGLIWFTDWKLVLQYVPYIGGKFKTED